MTFLVKTSSKILNKTACVEIYGVDFEGGYCLQIEM